MLSSYDSVLDEIYRTFMAVKDDVKGKPDSEVRDPHVLCNFARDHGLIPAPKDIIRVTGSKGKGTTSRMIAKYLQESMRDRKVALFVSPEEFEHTDRMTIDGIPISQDDFVRIFNELHNDLLSAEASLPERGYLSPFGIFMLIAMKWFKERSADVYVLETGRGAASDEVGQIPSHISVVTSVLFEHPDALGPTIDDIARNKLAIGNNSDWVVLGDSASIANTRLEVISGIKCIEVKPPKEHGEMPSWLSYDAAMAICAAKIFLEGRHIPLSIVDVSNASTSFGHGKLGLAEFVYEAAINLDSIDRDLLDNWRSRFKRVGALVSFPDDKDHARLVGFFESSNFDLMEIILEGTRGYLTYENARTAESTFTLHYNDATGFVKFLRRWLNQGKYDFVYFVGTQTYIRLVKRALSAFRTSTKV